MMYGNGSSPRYWYVTSVHLSMAKLKSVVANQSPTRAVRPLIFEVLAIILACGGSKGSVARELCGDVPFMRPEELALDDTPTAAAVRHALEFAEHGDQKRYDAVILIEPTSPCRDPASSGGQFASSLLTWLW